jgi:hypothetical protein
MVTRQFIAANFYQCAWGRARDSKVVSKPTGSDVFSLSSSGWRRGGAFLFRIPLSSVLSPPFVPHGERKKSSSFETASLRARLSH